jgi:hypothetical protein
MKRKTKGMKKWWESNFRFHIDSDGDNVEDWKDCRPFNSKKQHDYPRPDRRPMPMPVPLPLGGKKKRKWL